MSLTFHPATLICEHCVRSCEIEYDTRTKLWATAIKKGWRITDDAKPVVYCPECKNTAGPPEYAFRRSVEDALSLWLLQQAERVDATVSMHPLVGLVGVRLTGDFNFEELIKRLGQLKPPDQSELIRVLRKEREEQHFHSNDLLQKLRIAHTLIANIQDIVHDAADDPNERVSDFHVLDRGVSKIVRERDTARSELRTAQAEIERLIMEDRRKRCDALEAELRGGS